MKSEELARQIDSVCDEAINRVLGVGHDQYASGPVEVQTLGHAHKVIVGEEYQQFEDETADDNLDGLEEELLDCINWAAMAILKIRSARAKADRITP